MLLCHLRELLTKNVQVANMFQNEVQARMVSSFEERCRLVYGLSMVH
jgi:hypothetical protein